MKISQEDAILIFLISMPRPICQSGIWCTKAVEWIARL